MDDLDKIKKFLDNLKDDLQDYVEKYNLLVPDHPEMESYFIKAWDEVKPTFDHFNIIINLNIQQDNLLNLLKSNGLTGNQLDLKLSLIHYARVEYQATLQIYNQVAETVQKEENIEHKNALKRLLGKIAKFLIESKKGLLNKDDIPLSSLIQAIPVFGDSIVEFKDAAISTLDG